MRIAFLSSVYHVVHVIRSKNTKGGDNGKEEESHRNMETGDNSTGSGMFKHMKSIDDKIDQVRW